MKNTALLCGVFRLHLFVDTGWRSGRDSNPRGIAPKLISSQPRYDHFDTAACIFCNTSPQNVSQKDGSKVVTRFRVVLVMTTSIHLRVENIQFSAQMTRFQVCPATTTQRSLFRIPDIWEKIKSSENFYIEGMFATLTAGLEGILSVPQVCTVFSDHLRNGPQFGILGLSHCRVRRDRNEENSGVFD